MTKFNDSISKNSSENNDILAIINHLNQSYKHNNFKESCGSYIALDKIIAGKYQMHDGLYTLVNHVDDQLYIRKKGKYLRGFSIGNWDKIPDLYVSMLKYASDNNLILGEYAFERGLNEFCINDISNYICEITIYCTQN